LVVAWLRQMLTAAADHGRPIVLVVDGLDEADEHDVDHLPFGLPDDLPRGIYVVATIRTGGLRHQRKRPKVVCDWNRRQPQQQADLRAFITESVQPRLLTALRNDGMVPEAFVAALLDKCVMPGFTRDTCWMRSRPELVGRAMRRSSPLVWKTFDE
jgi:hypothetical protein